MNSTRYISLRSRDVRSCKSLRGLQEKESIERLKKLTEGGCKPLHIETPESPTDLLSIRLHNSGFMRLKLTKKINQKAQEIFAQENRKLKEKHPDKEWIDGEKLALQTMSLINDEIYLTASIMGFSHILAMKDFDFGQIAGLKALKLDTNTHVVAREGEHRLLLVAQRGKKPGDPRLGTESLCAPVGSEVQWTLATNGMIDADVVQSTEAPAVWVRNSFKEFKEELGVEKDGTLIKYLGMMVDTVKFTGATGILGMIETEFTPDQIEEKRTKAIDKYEVPVLDAIALEKEAIARFLRENRGNMVPQLITGLAVLGFVSWGEDFLARADR